MSKSGSTSGGAASFISGTAVSFAGGGVGVGRLSFCFEVATCKLCGTQLKEGDLTCPLCGFLTGADSNVFVIPGNVGGTAKQKESRPTPTPPPPHTTPLPPI